MLVLDQPPISAGRTGARATRPAITIGLINNMGDEALRKTERQFEDLVSASAGHIDARLRLFAFGRTPRSARAADYLGARYEPAGAAMRSQLDALIVTGAQPRAPSLKDEPYWQELTEIIDRAKENTASTILSCLAAHAGVLHLDSVERRPLREKIVGVFDFTVARDHPLVGEQGTRRLVPHSRYNGLAQSDLEFAGYDILTCSPRYGVDCFTKSFGSQFVFLQGHPEYDVDSLAREHHRDLGRYCRGETDAPPVAPKGYFEPKAEGEVRRLHQLADANPHRFMLQDLPKLNGLAPRRAKWRRPAIAFYRSWMETLAASARARRDAGTEGPGVPLDERARY